MFFRTRGGMVPATIDGKSREFADGFSTLDASKACNSGTSVWLDHYCASCVCELIAEIMRHSAVKWTKHSEALADVANVGSREEQRCTC